MYLYFLLRQKVEIISKYKSAANANPQHSVVLIVLSILECRLILYKTYIFGPVYSLLKLLQKYLGFVLVWTALDTHSNAHLLAIGHLLVAVLRP